MSTIFSKIITGEIPCYKIAENEHFLAFLDINPDVDFFNLHKRSKQILNFDNFPDEYIKKNLTTIQTYLSPIVDNKWINTTTSMHSMMVDLATDKSHPGPLTQKKYAEMIVNFLKKQTI